MSHMEYFICQLCGMKFISQKSLNTHRAQQHSTPLARLDTYTSSVVTHTKLFKCDVTYDNVVTLDLSPPTPELLNYSSVPGVSKISDAKYILQPKKDYPNKVDSVWQYRSGHRPKVPVSMVTSTGEVGLPGFTPRKKHHNKAAKDEKTDLTPLTSDMTSDLTNQGADEDRRGEGAEGLDGGGERDAIVGGATSPTAHHTVQVSTASPTTTTTTNTNTTTTTATLPMGCDTHEGDTARPTTSTSTVSLPPDTTLSPPLTLPHVRVITPTRTPKGGRSRYGKAVRPSRSTPSLSPPRLHTPAPSYSPAGARRSPRARVPRRLSPSPPPALSRRQRRKTTSPTAVNVIPKVEVIAPESEVTVAKIEVMTPETESRAEIVAGGRRVGRYHCGPCNYTTNMKFKFEQHMRAHGGRFVCKVWDIV